MTTSRMKLPNCHRAVVDLGKLSEYCLNPNHEEGRHKARVFMSALGVGQKDAAWLQDHILKAVTACDAIEQSVSPYGRRYLVDMVVAKEGRSATLRTTWIAWLQDHILKAVTACDAIEQSVSPYGRRYLVDMVVAKEGRSATLRTTWIIRCEEEIPRLTTCFVL